MRNSLVSFVLLVVFASGLGRPPALCGYRTAEEAGVANVLLFYYDPARRDLSGCHSMSGAFRPYVGYLDTSGHVVDRFFDGILLMDTSPFFGNPSAATKDEWSNYLETTFEARRIEARPVVSRPGYMSRQCVQVPYRNGCVYQDSIRPKNTSLTVRFYVKVDSTSDERDDGYVGVVANDEAGCEITQGLSGLTYSTYLGLWYRYVDADTSWAERQVQFRLPQDAHRLSVLLGSWHTTPIYYDNVRLDGGVIADGDFESQTSIWKSRGFPSPLFPHDSSSMLAALDEAVGTVASQLQDPNMRESVILMIPWDHRSHLQTRFGRIDGRECDLSRPRDATRAVRWFVRRCTDEWGRLQPRWLTLAGFYWLNEAGNDYHRVDFPAISDYAHRLGYRVYASPYHSFWHESSKGKEYVPYFDCLWLQPNAWPADPHGRKSKDYYSAVKRAYKESWLSADSAWVRNSGIPLEELAETQAIAESLGMGINIEWSRGQEEVKGYGRVLDYIDRGDSLPHDFTEASHLFYDAGGFGWYCCYSDSAVFREQYDAVYRFVKRSRGR